MSVFSFLSSEPSYFPRLILAFFSLHQTDGSVALFKDDKPMTIPVQIMGLRVTKVGLSYKITLELIGLTINWDTERLANIEATAALFNRTAGLCGTLDQDPSNDFASKDGTVHKVYFFFIFFCFLTSKAIKGFWRTFPISIFVPIFNEIQQTISTFIDAWQIPDTNCDNEISNDQGLELVCTDAIKAAAKEMCTSLLSNEKFKDCLAV